MKRVIFTTLVTIASTAGAALGARAVDAAWRKARRERPPAVSHWIQAAIGLSLSKPMTRWLGARAA